MIPKKLILLKALEIILLGNEYQFASRLGSQKISGVT